MKYTHTKRAIAGLIFAGAILLPLAVNAGYTPPDIGTVNLDVGTKEELESLADQIAGSMQFILFAAAGIFIVIAGYQYLTAQGDADKTVGARNMIFYAVIAIVIGLLAIFLKDLVLNFLRTPPTT